FRLRFPLGSDRTFCQPCGVSGLPFNGVVRSVDDLSDAVATGIATREYYIASMDELRYVWPDAKPAAERFEVLQAFAEQNGWQVTLQRGMNARFEENDRDVSRGSREGRATGWSFPGETHQT